MLADLAGAIDEVFVTAKFCQAHGAAGVELVGADADLGSESKLAAVIEAGAGIVHDHGAFDLMLETLSRSAVGGDDAVGVMRAVVIDVSDGLIEIGDCFGR